MRAKDLRRPLGIAVRDGSALVVAEPVDVAFDAEQRCSVSDSQGTVHRIDEGNCPL